jgi:hypothetical protein
MKNLQFGENRLVFNIAIPGRGSEAPENKEAMQTATQIKKIATPAWIKKFKNLKGKTQQNKEKKQAMQVASLMTKNRPDGLGYVALKTDSIVNPVAKGFRAFVAPDGKKIKPAQFVSLCKQTAKVLNKTI